MGLIIPDATSAPRRAGKTGSAGWRASEPDPGILCHRAYPASRLGTGYSSTCVPGSHGPAIAPCWNGVPLVSSGTARATGRSHRVGRRKLSAPSVASQVRDNYAITGGKVLDDMIEHFTGDHLSMNEHQSPAQRNREVVTSVPPAVLSPGAKAVLDPVAHHRRRRHRPSHRRASGLPTVSRVPSVVLPLPRAPRTTAQAPRPEQFVLAAQGRGTGLEVTIFGCACASAAACRAG